MTTEIHRILKKYWGYDAFRPLQQDIILSVLEGKDTLGLMPTGGGKSITFQVPAMMLEGVTVVVTPLISLMKDQVDNLRQRHIRAVYIHSGMTMAESNKARETLFNGKAKFLYVSPERLRNERFMQQLKMLKVSLIVVDEAHCISQWGYDFRPAYLNIRRLRKILKDVPVLALTATATPDVEQDILRQLEMSAPCVFRKSFTRENLNYIVRPTETKIAEIFHILSRTEGSAIVYVRSRKRTREIAEYLQSCGISATFYHAGLDPDVKEERQNHWKWGETRVMVATNAFGMGIDKPDVRVVIHFDMPPSLEEYYQEAGRAGRDGQNAWVVLLTAAADKGVLRRKVAEAFPDKEIIRKVYERACNFIEVALGEGYDTLHEFDIDRFCEVFQYQKRQCLASLRLLGQAGYLEFMEESEYTSRAMIECTREDLYHIGKMSANAEKILSLILRLYTGLFIEYVNISEGRLARESGLNERQVYEALLELGRMKVVSYIPRSRTPILYLPTSREEPRYISIGKNIYEERREIISRRIEAMIDFAFLDSQCREQQLLRYFGENVSHGCGRCDVCRNRRASSAISDADAIGVVSAYLQQRPRGADIRLLLRDIRLPERRIAELLAFLCSEGFAESRDNFYFWIDKGAK